MLEEPEERSFTDEETEFFLPKMPTTIDGHYRGEPTGVVICLACLQSDKNIDRIPHESHCPQRFVHSQWWREGGGRRQAASGPVGGEEHT